MGPRICSCNRLPSTCAMKQCLGESWLLCGGQIPPDLSRILQVRNIQAKISPLAFVFMTSKLGFIFETNIGFLCLWCLHALSLSLGDGATTTWTLCPFCCSGTGGFLRQLQVPSSNVCRCSCVVNHPTQTHAPVC